MNSGPISYKSNLGDLGAAVLAYAKASTKALPVILEEQGNRLSCSDFGDGNRGLFQESAATAPTEQYLLDLPAQRAYLIKHPGRPLFTEGYELLSYKRGARKGQYRRNRKGQIAHKLIGVEGEIPRRIRHRGFQAAGWLSNRLGRYAAGAASSVGQKPNRAVVALVLTGSQMSISIVNTSPGALEVAERTGYLTRVLENRTKDLIAHVQQKLDKQAREFNALRLPPPH